MKKSGKLFLAATLSLQLAVPSQLLAQALKNPIVIDDPNVPDTKKPTAPARPGKPGAPKPKRPPVINDPIVDDGSNSSSGDSITPADPISSSNQGITIGNIDVSMVPDVTCPLVDNQPRQDLVAAAKNLSDNLAPLKQCKTSENKDASNSSEVDAMQSYLNSITQAGKNLQQYIENPELVAADKTKLKDIQGDVDTLIRGIDKVSQVMMKNSLMGGECAKGMMKMTDLIMSLSDLVQSATPYAMMALEASPASAAALPYVIGVSAAGNVAKVIKRINDEKSIDLSDEKTRLAVLQNICEYTRIVQRVRAFNQAKRGDLREATEQLNNFNSFSKKLFSKYSAQAQQVVETSNHVKSELDTVKKSAINDQAELASLFQAMRSEKDSKLACYTVRELVKNAGRPDELPTRAILNMKQALSNKTFLSESSRIIHSALLTAEESLRNKITRENQQDSSWSLESCAADGKAYLDALNRLANSTQNLAINMQSRVDQKLIKNSDPEVSSLAKEQISLGLEKKKIELLQASANELANKVQTPVRKKVSAQKPKQSTEELFLETTNKDNGVNADSNINRNLIEAKLALFGKRDGWFGTQISAPHSPAYAWYLDLDQVIRNRNLEFEKEMNMIRYQAQILTRSHRGDYTIRDKNGKMIRRMSQYEITKQNIADVEAKQNLGTLSLPQFRNDPISLKQICSRLNNTLDIWQGIVDHLGSLTLYCSHLRDYMDQSFDLNLVRACQGSTMVKMSSTPSDLSKLRKDLGRSAQEAQLIQNKIEELRCE